MHALASAMSKHKHNEPLPDTVLRATMSSPRRHQRAWDHAARRMPHERPVRLDDAGAEQE